MLGIFNAFIIQELSSSTQTGALILSCSTSRAPLARACSQKPYLEQTHFPKPLCKPVTSSCLCLVPTRDCAICYQPLPSALFIREFLTWAPKATGVRKATRFSSHKEDNRPNKKVHEASFTPIPCPVYVSSATNLSPRGTPAGRLRSSSWPPFPWHSMITDLRLFWVRSSNSGLYQPCHLKYTNLHQ